jgi:hypothetical protein
MSLRSNTYPFHTSPKSNAARVFSVGERLLQKHLKRDCFLIGVEEGAWRLVNLMWPRAVFALGDRFSSGDGKAVVNFCLGRYPIDAPTLQLWDPSTNMPLAVNAWPKWYIDFITRYYPDLVRVSLEPYTPQLLTISSAIAERQKVWRGVRWAPSGNITQVLTCLVECFRSARPLPFDYPLAG